MDDQFDNRELIIEYLESGCKGGDMGYIGVEIEQFVLDEDGDRVPYIEKHGRLGVRDILEQLSPYYSEVVRNEEGDILSLFRLDSNVTIEPAAQLELSISPMLSLADVEHEYDNFALRMKQILKPYDYKLVPVGIRSQEPRGRPPHHSQAALSLHGRVLLQAARACMPNA